MMPDKNPCEMEDMEEESSMNVPNGTENEKKPFIPPTDMTDISFLKLASKMKKLSEETLDMIRKDLQPDAPDTEKKVEVTEKEVPLPEKDSSFSEGITHSGRNGEAKIVKVEAKDITPAELLMGLKKVLGYSK